MQYDHLIWCPNIFHTNETNVTPSLKSTERHTSVSYILLRRTCAALSDVLQSEPDMLLSKAFIEENCKMKKIRPLKVTDV